MLTNKLKYEVIVNQIKLKRSMINKIELELLRLIPIKNSLEIEIYKESIKGD